jgi:hypothetical protein
LCTQTEADSFTKHATIKTLLLLLLLLLFRLLLLLLLLLLHSLVCTPKKTGNKEEIFRKLLNLWSMR